MTDTKDNPTTDERLAVLARGGPRLPRKDDPESCWFRPIPTIEMLERAAALRLMAAEDLSADERIERDTLITDIIHGAGALLGRHEDLLGYNDGTASMIPGEGLLPVKVAKLLARVEELERERVAPVAELTFHGPVGEEELEGLRKSPRERHVRVTVTGGAASGKTTVGLAIGRELARLGAEVALYEEHQEYPADHIATLEESTAPGRLAGMRVLVEGVQAKREDREAVATLAHAKAKVLVRSWAGAWEEGERDPFWGMP